MANQPPSFITNIATYRLLVETWSSVTNIAREKQGGVLLISLSGKPQQYCLSIPRETIASKEGVNAILDTLEKIYEPTCTNTYKLFSGLATMRRDKDEPMSAYIQRYERRLKQLEDSDFTIPDEVLTFQFLEGSNMTESNKQLITVTCPTLNFKNVKEAVERLYSHGNIEKIKQEEKVSVKHEPDITLITDSMLQYKSQAETRPQYQNYQAGDPRLTTESRPYYKGQTESRPQYDNYQAAGNPRFSPNQYGQQAQYSMQQQPRPQYAGSPRFRKPTPDRMQMDDPGNWKCSGCDFYNNFSIRSSCFWCKRGRQSNDLVGQFRGPVTRPKVPNWRQGNQNQYYVQPQPYYQSQYHQPCVSNYNGQYQQSYGSSAAYNQYQQPYNEPTNGQHSFEQQNFQQRSSSNNSYFVKQSEQIFHQGGGSEGGVQELSNLMQEYINHSLLDCGATRTVAGNLWFNIFLQSLPQEKLQSVSKISSNAKFKFGDGDTVQALFTASIPCTLGGRSIQLAVEVVDSNVPLLISNTSLMKMKAVLDFENAKVTIFGNDHPVGIASSGHYVIPLFSIDSTFMSTRDLIDEKDPRKCAKRLHLNFAHANSKRIIQLLKKAGIKSSSIYKQLEELDESCDICLKLKRPLPRPKVCLPLATTFNGCVAMDLKLIKTSVCRFWILHITDVFTRYSMGMIVKDKSAEQVLVGMFRWIGIFGRPGKFLFDNGTEFDNHEMKELASRCNVMTLSAAVEAPWSNGICERGNSTIGEMIVKTLNDVQCKPEVAVQWAVNAKKHSV